MPHGAADGTHQQVLAREGKVPVHPAREVAGVGDENGIPAKPGYQGSDDGAHVEQAVGRRRPGHGLGHRLVELSDPGCALRGRLAGQAGQRLQHGDGIGHQRLGGGVVAPDLARIVVDVDERLARHRRGRQRIALRGRLAETRADGEDQVGLQIALDRRLGDLEAQVPRVVGVRIGEIVLPLEGERHRQVLRLRRRQQRLAPGRRPNPAAAGDQQRPLRLGDQRRDLRDVGGRGRPRLRHPEGLDDRGLGDVLQHVLGQHHHHRSRRRRLSLHEGARHDLRYPRRVVDEIDGLGHVGEGLGVIHLLERAPADLRAWDLADEQHQRHRILLGHVHRDRGIGGAWPAADEGDAGAPAELAVAHGHQAGAALVAAHDGLNGVAVVQRVERGEVALARHAVDPVHAMRSKAIDEQVGGAAGHGWVSTSG